MKVPAPNRPTSGRLAVFALAAVSYLPLLVTHRGQVGADTKSYLYLNPERLLGRAWSMWDPNVGLGTVPHQNIGYLWPMGPFYWAFEHLGFPDWVAQRVWLGSILFLAGLGARYLMKTLGLVGPGVVAGMFMYALTPYVLTLGARISALLLPFTALGWMMAFVIKAGRDRGWTYPALFALAVPTFGSTNATALILVGVAPALWIPYAVWGLKELNLRQALGVLVRIGSATIATSLWWMVGLWCQGSFGLDVLSYTETARTVADASAAPELMRGLGYWFFYGDDKLGPWIEPSTAYTQNPGLILLSYALPVFGLLAAALTRWRYRAFFVMQVTLGLILAAGAHPWGKGEPLNRGFEAFLNSAAGLAMRSLPRAVPLIALALAVLAAAGIDALNRQAPKLSARVSAGIVLIALIGLMPLWRGQMIANNLQRPETLPDYWVDAAKGMEARSRTQNGWSDRVWEVPGADFASYRWGNTVDPITPGLIDRPYVARELIPYGTPASADLLNSFDHRLQEGTLDPRAVAPLARLMGVGDVALRGDLAYERYNLARPRQVYAILNDAPGLGMPVRFGSNAPNLADPNLPLIDEYELGEGFGLPNPNKVMLYPVLESEPKVRTANSDSEIWVSGNGDGLVTAASAGVLDGHELIRYSAASVEEGTKLRVDAANARGLIITDTNRFNSRRWGTVRENDGMTQTANWKSLRLDPSDNPLPTFRGAPITSKTVAVISGGANVNASSYGNPITYTAENRPIGAFDSDPKTSWYTAAFDDPRGEFITVTYDKVHTTDGLWLTQASNGVQNRWITKVDISFDREPPKTYSLDQVSRTGEGQLVSFPKRSFRNLRVTIKATDTGVRDTYNALSGVGFKDVRLAQGDLRLSEAIKLPTDLLDALGSRTKRMPLVFVLSRQRTVPTVPLRDDEEASIVRLLSIPTARSFGLSGTIRLSDRISDERIDELVGQSSVVATSSRRLSGDRLARAFSAVDGDPLTHWSPGFLDQEADWSDYRYRSPISISKLDLSFLTDGRHSVPTKVTIEVDRHREQIEIPELSDRTEPGSTQSVSLALAKPLRGRHIRFTIDEVREVKTTDWVSKLPVTMPVGVVEWGLPSDSAAQGLAPSSPADLAGTCRSGLLRVNGQDLAISISGSVDQALAGEALDFKICDDLRLPAGEARLKATPGRMTGFDIDSITLRSGADGSAVSTSGSIDPKPEKPATVLVTNQGRWRSEYQVGARSKPTWLVIGESHNLGWKAEAEGVTLGPPHLVNGYSSAFLLPAGPATTVKVVWWPQKVVFVGLGASGISAILLTLITAAGLWRLHIRKPVRRSDPSGAVRAEVPSLIGRDLTTRALGVVGTVLMSSVAAGIGYMAVNPLGAGLLAIMTIIVARMPRSHPLLRLIPATSLALAAAFIVIQQIRHELPAGFYWPARFEQSVGVVTAGLIWLSLQAVIETLQTRKLRGADQGVLD